MQRIAIGMDEVLAGTLAEHIARYNRDHREAITKADLEGKWLWDIVSIDRHSLPETAERRDTPGYARWREQHPPGRRRSVRTSGLLWADQPACRH